MDTEEQLFSRFGADYKIIFSIIKGLSDIGTMFSDKGMSLAEVIDLVEKSGESEYLGLKKAFDILRSDGGKTTLARRVSYKLRSYKAKTIVKDRYNIISYDEAGTSKWRLIDTKSHDRAIQGNQNFVDSDWKID